MTVLLSQRYIQNSDASTTNMRTYNEGPQDIYPTFTLCFKGTNFHWFHDHNIFRTYQLNRTQYDLMLKGEHPIRYDFNRTSRTYEKVTGPSKNISGTSFDQFHLSISDILVGLEFAKQNYWETIIYPRKNDDESNKVPPLKLVYQTADLICFGRKEEVPSTSRRIFDMIWFDTAIMNLKLYLKTELRIFVHYPGQLIASFDSPKYISTFYDFLVQTEIPYDGGNQKVLELEISQCKKLRKRPSSNIPCNPNIRDYDKYLQEKIINDLGCVPVYWEKTFSNNSSLSECLSVTEHKKSHQLISNYTKILASYDKPCEKMILPITYKYHEQITPPPEQFTIKFSYTESNYEEIEYIKAFGFENFWSGIGGFVGIFLGYSMMQIPELLEYIILRIFREKCSSSEGKLKYNIEIFCKY